MYKSSTLHGNLRLIAEIYVIQIFTHFSRSVHHKTGAAEKKALRVRGNLGPNNHSLLPEPVLRVPGPRGTVGSTRRFEKIALRHGSLCLALVGFSHLIILCDRHSSSK